MLIFGCRACEFGGRTHIQCGGRQESKNANVLGLSNQKMELPFTELTLKSKFEEFCLETLSLTCLLDIQ